jgi:hypothetical protein
MLFAMPKWLSVTAVTLTVLAFTPAAVLAAGDDPPKPSSNQPKPKSKSKPRPKSKDKDSRLNQDEIYSLGYWQAKRGEYTAALATLRSAPNAADPRVETMIGFSLRKLGQVEEAMVYHDHAAISGRSLPPDRRAGAGQGAAGRDCKALRRRLRGLPTLGRRDRQVRTGRLS